MHTTLISSIPVHHYDLLDLGHADNPVLLVIAVAADMTVGVHSPKTQPLDQAARWTQARKEAVARSFLKPAQAQPVAAAATARFLLRYQVESGRMDACCMSVHGCWS